MVWHSFRTLGYSIYGLSSPVLGFRIYHTIQKCQFKNVNLQNKHHILHFYNMCKFIKDINTICRFRNVLINTLQFTSTYKKLHNKRTSRFKIVNTKSLYVVYVNVCAETTLKNFNSTYICNTQVETEKQLSKSKIYNHSILQIPPQSCMIAN